MSNIAAAFFIGMFVGLLPTFVATFISIRRGRQQPPKGLSTSFELCGANDVEMDTINAAIRREWNTRQEDDAWKHL